MFWNYYEGGIHEIYDFSSVKSIYELIVDKKEYPSFNAWIYDMEKMQILIKE